MKIRYSIFIIIVIVVLALRLSAGFAANKELRPDLARKSGVRCKITVPTAYAIVRGDVPVYGFAEGEGFKEYKLEYGAGENPKEWILISKANKSQAETTTDPKIDLDLVKTIPGNLGMWETGLSEYAYQENLIDLPMGLYTLRLTVFGQRNKKAEDKITVEVGRVLLNCRSGRVESADKKVVLTVPEQSLYKAIEIVSIKPIQAAIYELNPPGLAFTRKATLTLHLERKNTSASRQAHIAVYNPATKSWQVLESYYNEKENTVATYLTKLPDKFAVYSVIVSSTTQNAAVSLATSDTALLKPSPHQDGVLCHDTFEEGLGQWHNDYGAIGAKLERDTTQHGDGSACLKLTNQTERGNFAAQIRQEAYNAKEYPLIAFDYKMPAGVKINLLAKVNNIWYDLVFTDEEKVYWGLNMEKIGKIADVRQDNQWQAVSFNLYAALEQYYQSKIIKTPDYTVQELVFANWDSTGFMKLELGHNSIGVAYYIDNFMIKGE